MPQSNAVFNTPRKNITVSNFICRVEMLRLNLNWSIEITENRHHICSVLCVFLGILKSDKQG